MDAPAWTPPENPKHDAGEKKPSMHYTPPSAIYELGRVMQTGAEKYGAFNWGDAGANASVYYDAAFRHLAAWWAGEDQDSESRITHLAHVMACCTILIDCQKLGVLVDDRPTGRTAVPFTVDKDGN